MTNHHVVNSPLPLTVRVKVLDDGKYVEKEFKNVEVFKVHKTYDLALLKLNSGDRFKALKVSGENKVATGDKCYVIGNPDAGEGGSMRNSITEGLVSASERVIDDLTYLQISAAINPGNSGGASVDSKGSLVGIVTFKVSETEGIGFAIPTPRIKPSDFVDPSEKTGNRDLGIEYEDKGTEFFNRSRLVQDPELKDFMVFCAMYFFRMSLREMPNESSPYHNVGLAYYNLGEKTIATGYFEKAMEMDPESANTLHMLGICYFEKDRKKDAQKLWLKGAFKGEGATDRCAENAAISALEESDFLVAAYLSRLAQVLGGNYNSTKRQKIFSRAAMHISETARNKLQMKTQADDFSAKEMWAWRDADKGLKTRERAREHVVAANQTSDRKGFAQKVAHLVKKAPLLPDEWSSKKIPGTVTRILPVLGGARIALTVKDLKKIMIYDTLSADGFNYITIPSADVLLAAGGRNLVAYYPALKIIEFYDMVTGEKLKARRLKTDYAITSMVMGMHNPNLAFISYGVGTKALDKREYAFLDLDRLLIRPVTSATQKFTTEHPNRFWNTSYREDVHFIADNNLDRLVCWVTSHSPQGYEYVKLDQRKLLFENTYEHTTYGALGLSSDGEFVFTTKGYVIQKEHRIIKQFPNSSLFRVMDGNFFIQVLRDRDNREGGDKAILREAFSQATLREFDLPIKTETWFRNPSLTADQIVIASALTNRINVLDVKNSMLYTRPLIPRGNGGSGGSTAGNSLAASPGEKWTFNLMLPEEEKAKIEDAPAGVKLVQGCLEWVVPTGTGKGVKEILVSIKSPEGKENYRVIKVLVQ